MAEDEENEQSAPALWPLRPREPEVPYEEPFEYDDLDRKPKAQMLTRILERTETPLVLGLDSAWGTGKTTFVRMWAQDLKNQGFENLFFNAWESDYVAEPLVALVGELGHLQGAQEGKEYDQVKKLAGQVARNAVPVAVRLLTAGLVDLRSDDLEKALGEVLEEVVEERIAEYEAQKNELEKFRDALTRLVKSVGGGKPVVFFIDEMDRCRPTFAVELLERVKHLFEVEGVIFVLSLHKAQLAHSIRAVCGPGFDAEGYLGRFFDLTYELPSPEPQKYGRLLANRFGLERWDDFRDVLVFLMDHLGFSLRLQERCIARASLVLKLVDLVPGDPSWFLAGITALRDWDQQLYRSFVHGHVGACDVLKKVENADSSGWHAGNHHSSRWVECSFLRFESVRMANEGGLSLPFDSAPEPDRLQWHRERVENDGNAWSEHIIALFEDFQIHYRGYGNVEAWLRLVGAVELSGGFKE